MSKHFTINPKVDFVLERFIDAPKHLVFRAPPNILVFFSMKGLLRAAAVVLALTAPDTVAQSRRPPSSGPGRSPKPAATSATEHTADTSATVEIYGFAMGDAIYDFNQNNPNWFDVNRPTKLPAFKNEFGANGHAWISARQSQFGVKATVPVPKGPAIKVQFEYDLFGVGEDEGQFTIHPRYIVGQWGQFGAGHNVGSIRVLEKCGFSLEREEGFELAGTDVAGLVLVLR